MQTRRYEIQIQLTGDGQPVVRVAVDEGEDLVELQIQEPGQVAVHGSLTLWEAKAIRAALDLGIAQVEANSTLDD